MAQRPLPSSMLCVSIPLGRASPRQAYTSKKETGCHHSFRFIVLSVIGSSVAESSLSVRVVNLWERPNAVMVGHILPRECKKLGGRPLGYTYVSAADNIKPKTVASVGSAFTPHLEYPREQQPAEHLIPLSCSQKGKTWPPSCPALRLLAPCLFSTRGQLLRWGWPWAAGLSVHRCGVRI